MLTPEQVRDIAECAKNFRSYQARRCTKQLLADRDEIAQELERIRETARLASRAELQTSLTELIERIRG